MFDDPFENQLKSNEKKIINWFYEQRSTPSWPLSSKLPHWVQANNGILFPKLFKPTVRKNCSTNWEKLWNSRLKAENLQKFWDH